MNKTQDKLYKKYSEAILLYVYLPLWPREPYCCKPESPLFIDFVKGMDVVEWNSGKRPPVTI
jgi:hypothetical protein